MTDERVKKFAHILVDHSTRIQPGDRVLVEGTTAALPLIEVLYKLILERGGLPYLDIELPDAQKMLYKYGSQAQLEHVPTFKRLAYEQFESRMRIHSVIDPRALNDVDPAKQAVREKALYWYCRITSRHW